MKTIGYCLLASILSKSEIDDIMKPLLRIGLPKSGVCRTMARSVVYGSISHQGLGVQYPFWNQGISKIQLLVDNSHTLSQQLLDVAWHNTVKETGLGDNFWDIDFARVKHIVTKGWYSTLWEFLSQAEGLSITRIDGLGHRPFRFEGDQYLMRMLLDLPGVSKDDIKVFNYCRLFLQVELISDIITADGKSIRLELWTGEKLRGIRSSYQLVTSATAY